MNTIHTFGDSFTFGHGCVENCTFNGYYAYKNDNDDIWPNYLAKKLGMNVINYGKSGFCNEQIFDSIVRNFDSIQENDIVIIEKTYHNRLSVPTDSEWVSALSDNEINFHVYRGIDMQDLIVSLPCDQRNELDGIERQFKLDTTGNKSNKINLIIKNSQITNSALQNRLKDIISEKLKKVLPITTTINNIEFR
jgi:hypothetical protein